MPEILSMLRSISPECVCLIADNVEITLRFISYFVSISFYIYCICVIYVIHFTAFRLFLRLHIIAFLSEKLCSYLLAFEWITHNIIMVLSNSYTLAKFSASKTRDIQLFFYAVMSGNFKDTLLNKLIELGLKEFVLYLCKLPVNLETIYTYIWGAHPGIHVFPVEYLWYWCIIPLV